MRSILAWLTVSVVSILGLLIKMEKPATALVPSAETFEPAIHCAASEYRQFDFWVGDWDAFEVHGSAKVARTRVDSILNGCVLQETYEGLDSHKGKSFTVYDASRKVWHQSWVTNRGQLLVIEGKLQDGALVLSGVDRTETGEERRVRGTWKPVDGGVRETAVTSTDAGLTWRPWFDIVFRPHAPAADDDAKLVAALDKQYQAAVKVNDAATMDRILAEGFVLVTGSGKIHTKSDLIGEARAGQTVFEKNEEIEQKVRVWGDTAVVTAKLWEKGTDNGKRFDHTLWFSDTYVRTPAGWRYVFGQSSLPASAIACLGLDEGTVQHFAVLESTSYL
jgi:ketosteroid isomerase-like protein